MHTKRTTRRRFLAHGAGKDVYVEKPLGTCLAEGRAMVAAARANGMLSRECRAPYVPRA